MRTLHVFFILSIISITLSLPSFKVLEIDEDETGCDDKPEPSYKIVILGEPTDITEPIKIEFYLESPQYGVARCTIHPPENEDDNAPAFPRSNRALRRLSDVSEMECLVDGFYYEIGRNKRIILPDKLPAMDGVEIKGWRTFVEEFKTVTRNADCNDPAFSGYVFESFKGSKLNYFGCFGSRNNFNFDVHLVRKDSDIDPDDMYFTINLARTPNSRRFDANCVVPLKEKKDDDIYTISCSTSGYDGTIVVNGYAETTTGNRPNDEDVYVLGSYLDSITVGSCY